MASLKFVPFDSCSQKERVRFLTLFAALAALIMLVFGITGMPLNTDAAPYGIVSFEIAGSVARAEQIISSWDAPARERATFSLGLDFLFIPIYAGAVILGIQLAADKIQGRLIAWRSWLIAALLLAALLDIVENIALLAILFQSPSAPLPSIARLCALLKFTLIIIGVIYALFGAFIYKDNNI
jgi:hypothetical protein